MFGPLGKKLIAHISIGGFQISFDLITIIVSWIVIALLVIFALILRRSLRQEVDEKPNRVQAMLDALIDLIKSQLTSSFSSQQLARELFPFIATLFMFILLSNWISVIPYFESPTKDLNVTFSFGLLVFFMSQYFALRRKGFGKYMKGFIEPYPFMLPLNIVGEMAKPLSHSFRLFGNMFGGAIMLSIIYMFVSSVPRILFRLFGDMFGAILSSVYTLSMSWVAPIFVNLFYGLFEGMIQAFVFSILAVAYINVAVET